MDNVNIKKYTDHAFDNELFSDLWKDVYGVRPAYNNTFYVSDINTKQCIWDDLLKALVKKS